MIEHEYSQGIASDGTAILKDGQPMTPERIVMELNAKESLYVFVAKKLDEAGVRGNDGEEIHAGNWTEGFDKLLRLLS